MNEYKIINQMYDIHLVINQEATGTPDEFAAKFRISRRKLYYLLEELKDYGAQIKYSRWKRTFYYAEEFEFTIKTYIFTSKKT